MIKPPSILIIAETKIDETFPTSQFMLNSFKVPYRLDKTNTSGGILVYTHIDISSKRLNDFKLPKFSRKFSSNSI